MPASFFAIALLAGWCGSDGGRRPPLGNNPPTPDPDPWMPALLGLIGGLLGGWLINRIIPGEFAVSASRLVLTAVGGYMGGMILNDLRKLPARFKS